MKKKKEKNRYNKVVIILQILFAAISSAIGASFFTQFLPPVFVGKYQIEFLLLFIFFLIGLIYLTFRYKNYYYTIIIAFGIIISTLLIGSIGWSPKAVWSNAYNSINLLLGKNAKMYQVEILPAQKAIAPHITLQQRIQRKVDYKNTIVRDFAVKHSLDYFDEYYSKYRQICRQFSLIKYIKDNYKYVNDPSGFDYFASPIESINLMAGDCDDYSILMASSLEAVGVDVRIIWAPKHVYPEMNCGNKNNFDKYVNAIYTCFPDEIKNKQIYYRLDKNNNYWLNLDYTDTYPGSPYHSKEVLSIIYIK